MQRGGKGGVRSLCYCTVFFLLVQVLLEWVMPLEAAYRDRVEFEILKDNPGDMACVLELIGKTVRREGISEYFIILGDSVAYSGPGGHEQAISRFMNDEAAVKGYPPVFNLAVPAAQPGDYYALLLTMDKLGISTDNVIINIIYGHFVGRDDGAAPVLWFDYDLRYLDPEAYERVRPQLEAVRASSGKSTMAVLKEDVARFLHYRVFPLVPVLKYRDFLRDTLLKGSGVPEKTGDTRPWYEKPYLSTLLKEEEYQRLFDPKPAVFDDSNPAAFFMRKIAEHQRGKNLFVFLSPVNSELMKEEVSRPGYRENLNNLNAFMRQLGRDYSFHYVDLSDSIPGELFSDHLHLTAAGYKVLAGILWDWVLTVRRDLGKS